LIMKKYVQNFWVRFLACLLCSVTLVAAVAYGALFVGVTMIGSKEDVNENGQRIIATNYGAYIYDLYMHNEKDAKEKLDTFVENKNFTYAISKVNNSMGKDVSLEEKTEVLYSNLVDVQEWDYQIEIEENAYVRYNVESVWDALRMSPIITSYDDMDVTNVTGYVFDAQTGLFYSCTSSGYYFLVDSIVVNSGDSSCDYIIKNEDGKKVYYNSYYGLTLDTTEYAQWNWINIYNTKLTISAQAEGKEIALVTDSSRIEPYIYTGIYYDEYDGYHHEITYYPDKLTDMYIVQIKLNDIAVAPYLETDLFWEWDNLQAEFYSGKDDFQGICISCILLFVFSFALLIYSANNDKEKIGFLQKVPVGIFTGCAVLLELPLFVVVYDVIIESFSGYGMLPFELWMLITVLTAFAMVFVAFIWLQNMIARFKTKTFIRHSEFYYGYKVIKWLWKKVSQPFIALGVLIRENTPLVIKGASVLLIIAVVEFFYMAFFLYHEEMMIVGFFVCKIVEVLLVTIVLLQMNKLQEGSKRIAAGDLSEPIDTTKMFWEFKKHGENINKVSEGISLAVEERMKSERFKTELITNVSHDIKTPLTSIINYVDLIKKEQIEDEKLCQYIDVLDRQSARLKKLIEDLMEASKASTGNLAVNMEDCNVEVLLTQLIGEFEEKLMANNLEVVVDKPEEPVLVKADGRHMWRVFDNLLNNACKYSLPGTRVYVNLTKCAGEVVITFKNISKAALNIPSDELMERFVRGDSSRNTEGSGLGLSIAQSLTELMDGTMKLDIDGDLFKVILSFHAINTRS